MVVQETEAQDRSMVDDEICDNSIDGEAACGNKNGGFINFFWKLFGY